MGVLFSTPSPFPTLVRPDDAAMTPPDDAADDAPDDAPDDATEDRSPQVERSVPSPCKIVRG
jgi:hypothetical protein